MFVVVDGFLLEHPNSPHKDVMACLEPFGYRTVEGDATPR